MDDFSQAQKLFSEFQKTWNYSTLDKALDILDELLEGDDKKRAENLKGTIDRFMKNEAKKIMDKYNIRDFASTGDDFISLLACATSEDDLLRIRSIMGYMLRDMT